MLGFFECVAACADLAMAGWAVMMLAATRPELCGPIIVAGSPLSYWAGIQGKNPMRYSGGLLGGSGVRQACEMYRDALAGEDVLHLAARRQHAAARGLDGDARGTEGLLVEAHPGARAVEHQHVRPGQGTLGQRVAPALPGGGPARDQVAHQAGGHQA